MAWVAVDGSDQVAVTAEVDDLEALQAMLASPPPEAAAQMESHFIDRTVWRERR